MGVAVSREPQQELFLRLLQEGHSDLRILVAGRGWGGGGAGREEGRERGWGKGRRQKVEEGK